MFRKAFFIVALSSLALSGIYACGSSGSSAPAATCSAISVPGFYPAVSLNGTVVSSGESFNLPKDLGWMEYFTLNSDGSVSVDTYRPERSISVEELQTNGMGTAYEHSTFTGTWSQNGDSLTVDLGENGSYTGTLSQSDYPDCFVSVTLTGQQNVPSGQGQTTTANMTFDLVQYPEGFDATAFALTFATEDSSLMQNSNGATLTADSGMIPTQLTFSSTDGTNGTFSGVYGGNTMTGEFTFVSNQNLSINFTTSRGSQQANEFFAYNPITQELVLMLYGTVADDGQTDVVATQYLLLQGQ